MRSIAIAVLSLFLSGVTAHAAGPQVQLFVDLSPAGSFVATSEALQGDLRVQGGSFTAEKILLKLETLKTGIELRDNHMKHKYFDTGKYPEAVMSQLVGRDGKFTGTLKIREASKPVSGTYRIENGVVFADFKTQISAYDIPKPKYMGVGADDEVAVKAVFPGTAAAPSSEGAAAKGAKKTPAH